MKCPKCRREQYCPCESCRSRLPKGKKPWIWVNGEAHKCSYCGYTAHADFWADIEWKQFKKSKQYKEEMANYNIAKPRGSNTYKGVIT